MKISVKGRYGLSAAICLAEHYTSGNCLTTTMLVEKLGISKLYLEQTFPLLKKANLVTSVKGAQGGYRLARAPRLITILDVLSATELTLFEKTQTTVELTAPDLEAAMQSTIFSPLDEGVKDKLTDITLHDLVNEVTKYRKTTSDYMFFI